MKFPAVREPSWTCHVCGEERPDAAISVLRRDDSAAFGRPPGSVPHNIRYCNDRPACIAGAPTARLPEVKGGSDELPSNLELKRG